MRRFSTLCAWFSFAVADAFIAGLALVVAAYMGRDLELHTRDRASLIGAAVGFDAMLFAAVAAVPALAAYLMASGKPRLDIEITFRFSEPSRLFEVKRG